MIVDKIVGLIPGGKPTRERLDEVFHQASRPDQIVEFDDTSRIIIMSDSHRGDGTWSDDFAQNAALFNFALNYYDDNDYIYIEAGDGDELWENPDFAAIREFHHRVFDTMVRFHQHDRFYLMWGNHDIERQDPDLLNRQLATYRDQRERDEQGNPKEKRLFGPITAREGIVLQHRQTGQRFFIVHGHQGGGVNDENWRIGRLAVRYFWSRLQFLGVHDPTRPSQNVREQREVENKIVDWICENRQPVICGHTHRSAFPLKNGIPYFNTGSSVFPRLVTGIEIVGGQIALVGWEAMPDDRGVVRYCRVGGVGGDDVRCFPPGELETKTRVPIEDFTPVAIEEFSPENDAAWGDCATVTAKTEFRSRGM
ncbi:MAG: metallophosphoesterase [Thermomicrobiales bacterium]